jgi:hypothetical protein
MSKYLRLSHFCQESQLLPFNILLLQVFAFFLTRSAAPSPVFEDGVKECGSGSTLSKPRPLSPGVEQQFRNCTLLVPLSIVILIS